VVLVLFNQHLHAARLEVEKGHNSAAMRHLAWCRSVRPEQREVLILSARVARRFGSLEEADAILATYSREYGDDEQLVLERLLYRASRGELEESTPALRMRISQGGTAARLAREALTNGLIYRFRWKDAQALLDQWLGENPDDTLALLLKAKLVEQQLNHDGAIAIYRKILDLDPEQQEARLRYASLLIGRRQGEEAAAELAILRQALPDHAEVQVLWARALSLLGRTDEARAAIDECLATHPDYPPALLERGNTALLLGDEAVAERYLSRAARLDPGNAIVRNQYALVLARNGKASEAKAQYDAVKQLEADSERIAVLINGPLQNTPNDPQIHYEIGMIALRSGLTTEAIRWFTGALAVDPNHLPTHRILASVYHELENPVLSARHRAQANRIAAQQGKP
jgi:tetratricopeptide (TPR) repeat protein